MLFVNSAASAQSPRSMRGPYPIFPLFEYALKFLTYQYLYCYYLCYYYDYYVSKILLTIPPPPLPKLKELCKKVRLPGPAIESSAIEFWWSHLYANKQTKITLDMACASCYLITWGEHATPKDLMEGQWASINRLCLCWPRVH